MTKKDRSIKNNNLRDRSFKRESIRDESVKNNNAGNQGMKHEGLKYESMKDDSIKYEIASELGLLDKISKYGWKSLTAKETGRIGGLVTRKKKLAGDGLSTESR